jgi:ssDNA-binding Zn-finger/Zn-ribbon topoisomerase 1
MSEPVIPERYKQEHADLSSPPVPSATWEWDTAGHKAMGQFAKKLIGEVGAAEAKVNLQQVVIERLKRTVNRLAGGSAQGLLEYGKTFGLNPEIGDEGAWDTRCPQCHYQMASDAPCEYCSLKRWHSEQAATIAALELRLSDQHATIMRDAATIERLHGIIEVHWRQQAGGHACGCSEWPECAHTLSAAEMRAAAMKLGAALNPQPSQPEYTSESMIPPQVKP